MKTDLKFIDEIPETSPQDLNEKQRLLVENIDGIYIVDAGAGTGKTKTITKRYEKILQEVSPDKILLLTFTENAAETMRNRIFKECKDTVNILKDLNSVNISTFHSFCNKILGQYGLHAGKYLGFDEVLKNYGILESSVYERNIFKSFFNKFKDENPKYRDFYRIVKYGEMLSIINRLCSKGIFPKKDGWFGNGKELLDGNFQNYKKQNFDKLNEMLDSKGRSFLMCKFEEKIKKELYLNEPSYDEIFDDFKVKPEIAELAFNEDRTLLQSFVHDLYFQYINLCLKLNKINFNFLVMFSFVLLYHEHELRNKIAFDYVMVDEFQDTDELQFMMLLMLMKTDNLCVVGDWKQGIYGFRNATIDNILNFEEKLKYYKEILNKDYQRINFNTEVKHFDFNINYRSSKEILDFSEFALLCKATDDEKIDYSIKDKIVSLEPAYSLSDRTKIEFLQSQNEDDEYNIIINKIKDIVRNGNYLIKEFKDGKYTERLITYKDIAVLSRTRNFALELQDRARKEGLPAVYEGGIELFKTEPAILILAWLRLIMNKNNSRGWIPILEKEGYNFGEINTIINQKCYPNYLLDFRQELVEEKKDITSLVKKIMEFHNFSDDYASALIVNTGNLFKNYLLSVPDLISFIEENMEQEDTYNISFSHTGDYVTIQTIHSAKGLEYPVVFIANVNQRCFPSTKTDSNVVFYHDLVGLRIKREYGELNGYKYIFNKWQTDLLTIKLFSDYDEERRLLYVAITRAKQYLFFTANDKPSKFFENMKESLPKFHEEKEIEIEYALAASASIEDDNKIDDIVITSKKTGLLLSVHDLMQCKEYKSGKGRDFGKRLHNFAHKIALGFDDEWNDINAQRLRSFIKSLNAKELKPEIDCSLPVGEHLIRGVIDLLVFYNDKIEIIEYKSDTDDSNEDEYRKQLSVYYHVVHELYPEMKIICKLYYVCIDIIKEIEPISIEDISALINNFSIHAFDDWT